MIPLLAALALGLGAPPPGDPGTIWAATHVIAVPDAEHIVVAHGKRDRFPADARGLFVTPRALPRDDRKNPPVDWGVVIARADVERVDATSAVLRLYDTKQSPKVGDHVAWSFALPKDRRGLREEALFWVASLDIGVQPFAMDRSFFDLRGLLADPKLAARALDEMVAELKTHAALASQVYPDPLDSGPHRGRRLGDVFAAATAADVLAFFDYVASEPWSYVTWDFRLVEIYGTWLVRGSPRAAPVKANAKLAAQRVALGQMLRQGRWPEAEGWLVELLRALPGDPVLRAQLDDVAAIRRADAALARNASDDGAAWVRGKALSGLGLSQAAVLVFERLIVREYKVWDAKMQLGIALCGAGRWAECEDVFDKMVASLGKRREPDADLASWRTYAHTRGAAGGNEPKADAASHIATAVTMESIDAWDKAITSWRNAVMLARGAGDEARFAEAERGLARALARQGLVERVAKAVEAVRVHDEEAVSRLVVEVRMAARDMGEKDAGSLELEVLEREARRVGERELADVVLAQRLEDAPSTCLDPRCRRARAKALADRAGRYAESGDVATAETFFGEAVRLAPDAIDVRAKRAWFFAEAGRWADAYSAAFLGAGQSASMTWSLVRASAARKRHDDTLEYADRLGRKAIELGLVDAAAHRLVAADEALGAATGAAAKDDEAHAVLRRLRALADLGLERVAFAELPRLAGYPALRAEAAWAIARPWAVVRFGADLVPAADRLAAAAIAMEGAPSRERARRRDVLAARVALAKAPLDEGARVGLAKALLADGEMHEAWAVARTAGAGGAVVVAAARRGVGANEQLTHARQARERGDASAQAELAEKARAALKDIAVAPMMDAMLLEAEGLGLIGKRKQAVALLADGLVAAHQDGSAERVRAFEGLLGRFGVLGDPRGPESKGPAKTPPRSGLEAYGALLAAHLAQCQAADDDRCVAAVLADSGDVATQRGRVGEARAALDEAAARYRVLHDGPRGRRVAMAVARVHRLRSELAAAAAKAREVLAEAVADRDGPAERDALQELSSLALVQGDLAAARKWTEAAREAAQRGNDELALARAELTLGRAEHLLGGDLTVALAALERARARFEKRGAAGDALEARLDRVDALALAASEHALPKKSRRLTLPASLDGAADEALALARDTPAAARALGRDVLALRASLSLANAHLAARDTALAVGELASADPMLRGIELPDLRARYESLVARVALAAQRRDDATDHALAAAQALAVPLAQGNLPLGQRETQRVFQAAADLLFELGRHGEALDVLELQRSAGEARTFDLERLARAADPMLAADIARFADARARADAATSQLRAHADEPQELRDALEREALVKLAAASQAELKPLAEQLERDHPAHWAALARDPTTLAAQRKKLPRDTLLVEYFASDEALYLFTVRPGPSDAAGGAIRALKVAVDARALDDTIARYRKLVTADARLAEPLARQLYTWLLEPLARLVPPDERAAATLILLPHGRLFDVPFPALVSSPAGAPTRYALEDWRLAIASARTLSTLFTGPRKLSVLGPVLGLTDPDGTLPEARHELDALPSAIPATVLRGPEATEARMLSLTREHRILHFATHGTLAPNPLDSALVLASGNLTVGRIAGLAELRGQVAMVFLSACRSASESGEDEEAISLADGFALAGVPTLIGSLWDVDDAATRVLVEGFYERLAARRLDTLGALREAQLATLAHEVDGRRPFADPRYWSAFQLIGDFR